MSSRTMAMKSIDDACNDACTLARALRRRLTGAFGDSGAVGGWRGCGI